MGEGGCAVVLMDPDIQFAMADVFLSDIFLSNLVDLNEISVLHWRVCASVSVCLCGGCD